MICAKSRQNSPSGSEEEVKNVQEYRQKDKQTDGQPEKLT
jgi:hypothetical protein